MKRIILTLVTCAAFATASAAGCSKKDEGNKDDTGDTKPADPTAKTPDKPAEPPPPMEISADEAIPTEADFEEEAETEITAKNLEDELKKLEGEFGDDD